MSRLSISLVIGLVFAGTTMAVSAQPGGNSMKFAVKQAIEHGQASFWANSAMAENVNRAMGRPASARVKVALQSRQRINADCVRLNARFMDETETPMFEMQMNICKDGSAPFEGMDLAQPVAPPGSTPVPRLKPLPASR